MLFRKPLVLPRRHQVVVDRLAAFVKDDAERAHYTALVEDALRKKPRISGVAVTAECLKAVKKIATRR